jgi:hypothetical protein
MAAGMEVFRAFEKDADDFAGFARTPLSMPMLVLSGEKAGGNFRYYGANDGRESIHALTRRVRANLSYLLRNKRVAKTGDRLTARWSLPTE